MQDPPPPTEGNVPHDNLMFDNANDNTLGDPPTPPQLPANLHMAHNERTLRDYALPSLDMVPGSITRWDKLARKFLQKFFPISKAVQLRREISVFR
ncbi:NADH--cytochrome b5 reductase 1-like [Gossypium australe]|uniref:NADH--cytochrome b5 reductase 1-like n=1 Tax=Gossypium australe TaxID=47621 RepID=A0A5B6WR87_9ROSI|nr:NADH--cytochrome b5 reductase 1-like [Gossypium australe]